MVGFHGAEPPAVAAAYDFSGVTTLVDVGGATGNMLAAILAKHPSVRGVLFDRPHVVGEAPALLKAHGVDERVTIESGSFFEGVPSGGDAYLLSHIIHDWTEEQCLTILGHCRAAMKPTGTAPDRRNRAADGRHAASGQAAGHGDAGRPGGQERTEAEYDVLLGKAGFRLNRVVPTESVASVVEALPA